MKAKEDDSVNCYCCTHFSEFKSPRQCDDINFIYGYCFKNSIGIFNGYPVYLPQGACKKHSAKQNIKDKGDD